LVKKHTLDTSLLIHSSKAQRPGINESNHNLSIDLMTAVMSPGLREICSPTFT